jgi:hypothetical protein
LTVGEKNKTCKLNVSKWRERERVLTRGTVKDSAEARLVPEYSMFFDFLIPILCVSFLGREARAISLFCD